MRGQDGEPGRAFHDVVLWLRPPPSSAASPYRSPSRPRRWSGAMLPSKRGRPLRFDIAEYGSVVWTCPAKTARLAVHFPMLEYGWLRRRPPPPPQFAEPPTRAAGAVPCCHPNVDVLCNL